jgi:antitoxin component YwqK of YwqJK toxin-antitoxin module
MAEDRIGTYAARFQHRHTKMTLTRRKSLESTGRRWTSLALLVAATWVAPGGNCLVVAEEFADSAAASVRTAETIRERFPNGQIKIERDVTIDAAGNYVNHGAWRMWNVDGELVAEGRYDMGRRSGRWVRQFQRDEAVVLSSAPFDQFESPFVAEADFTADRLEGAWTIADAQQRRCSRVTFKYGKRNGPATLWLPNGEVYREATFHNGSPVGELRERDQSGKLQIAATYVNGQQLVNKVTHFRDSEVKQTEAMCLVATVTEDVADDFWQLRFAEYRMQDVQLRHGAWKCWYRNGQPQAEGHFQYDRESGTFTWWHAHGQEAVEGDFVDGQPNGVWTWWHANGQKAAEGEYRNGQQVGAWRKWTDEGRLVQRFDTPSVALVRNDPGHRVQLPPEAGTAATSK